MLFLAASFLILQNAGAYQQSTLKPSSFEKPYESASYAKGNEFGMMISGVSRMIAQYQVEPTYAARGEFVAEFDDGSNPAASQWDLDWVSFGDFLDTSAYAIAEGLKIPRLLEASPDFHALHHNGPNAYEFYFQSHFEKLFNELYNK